MYDSLSLIYNELHLHTYKVLHGRETWNHCPCHRDGARKAAAHFGLILVRDIKGHNQSFNNYMSSKRLNKENARVVDVDGNEVLDVLSHNSPGVLSHNSPGRSHRPPGLETGLKSTNGARGSSQGFLRKLGLYKSIGHDWLHPLVLRALAGILARPVYHL